MYVSLQAWTQTMAEVVTLATKDGLKNKQTKRKLENTERENEWKKWRRGKLRQGGGGAWEELDTSSPIGEKVEKHILLFCTLRDNLCYTGENGPHGKVLFSAVHIE